MRDKKKTKKKVGPLELREGECGCYEFNQMIILKRLTQLLCVRKDDSCFYLNKGSFFSLVKNC